jgi:hypothetical protein
VSPCFKIANQRLERDSIGVRPGSDNEIERGKTGK